MTRRQLRQAVNGAYGAYLLKLTELGKAIDPDFELHGMSRLRRSSLALRSQPSTTRHSLQNSAGSMESLGGISSTLPS